MSARKRNRELALTRALITRAHPNAIADDPNAMRLRSEEELKAGLGHVLKEHSVDEGSGCSPMALSCGSPISSSPSAGWPR